MACSPPAMGECLEHEVIRNHLADITRLISSDPSAGPTWFAQKLEEKAFIANAANAVVPSDSRPEQTIKLLDAVKGRIDASQEPGREFAKFLEILQSNPPLMDLAKKLLKEYGKREEGTAVISAQDGAILTIPTSIPSPHPFDLNTPPPLPPYEPAPTLHPIDEYAEYLRSHYKSKNQPKNSKWPPTASKIYNHLAMVKKKKVSKEQAHEFTRATLQGNIDDIVREKEEMEYSGVGIQEDGRSLARFILVEGAPGIGKTRFAWEVSQRWSRGEILNQYRLVVLLMLRDKRVREAKSIYDLFYHNDDDLRREVAREIRRMHGESVLLLFAGYDELPGKLQTQESIFLEILNRECLPEATVLITTRPSATEFLQDQFKEQISQHIEILGFTSADVELYAHDVINDEKLYTKFTQYLNYYPHIRGLMYVPLNAAIIIEIYKEQDSDGLFPTTLTELYKSLTRGRLLRYLKSHYEYGKQEWTLSSFSDLPEELHEQFNTICGIAFQGILEGGFIFDGLARDFNTLDLMQSAPELYVDKGAVVSHNFFHLTLQEFLAAVHVSQKPTEEQLQHFTQTCQEESPSNTVQTSTFASHTDIHQDIPSQQGKHVQSSSEMVQPQKLSSPQPCLLEPTTTLHHGESIVPEEGLQEIQQDSEKLQLPPSQPPSSLVHSPLPQRVLPHEVDAYTLNQTTEGLSHQDHISVTSVPKRQQRSPVSEALTSTISSSQELASRPKVSLFTFDHFQTVQRFTAGLTEFKNIPLASLKPILLQEDGDRKHITLNSLHWLFEAQCISTYSEMIGETAELTFDYGKRIAPFDSYVLGYALSHINCAWDINLNKSHIGDEGLAMLVAGMKYMYSEATNAQSIRLNLSHCDITSEGLRNMNEIPQKVAASIVELVLSWNGGIREGVASLLGKLKSLKTLDLTDTDLTPQEIEQLAESLSPEMFIVQNKTAH